MAAFIAQGIAPLQLENPLNQMAKIYQIQQAQQENALARMKMQEYQRGAEEENRLRELYARPDVDIRSPEFLRQVYAVSPTRGAAMQKSAFEAQKAQRESDEAAEKLVSQRIANARGLLPSITPATWGAWRADTIAKLPGLANMIPEQYSDEARLQLMQTADQYLASRKPQVVGPDSSVYDPATGRFTQGPGRSQLLTPEEEAQKIRIAAAGRTPAQPREPAAPIAVVDDATGKVKYVSREEAMGKTPPSAIEGLTPKERQTREAKFPQATSALKAFDNTATTLIKDLETLANHPGLPSITGIAAGRLPGITSQGREAQALYDKIMARGGFQELQNMRQASPTGGALGNVSNAEGQRLQAAFAALDRRQDAPSVVKAIRDAITQTRAAQQNLREAYDLTYEYKPQSAAAPAPDVDINNPLLK